MRRRRLLVRALGPVVAVVPYPIVVGFARRLAGSALVQHLLFSRDLRLAKDIYEDACGIRLDNDAVKMLLMAKLLRLWQTLMARKFSDRDLERYVRINGLDRVSEISESGTSVMLASAHYIAAACVAPLLARSGLNFHTFRREAAASIPGAHIGHIYAEGDSLLDGFRKIVSVVKSGGTIHALFDGGHGTGTVAVPFLGRTSHFRRSLAELAWLEGAIIVPVSIRLDHDGHLLIDLHEPLSVDGRQISARTAAENISKSYATFLEATIRTYPWCFDPARIAIFWRRADMDKARIGRPKDEF